VSVSRVPLRSRRGPRASPPYHSRITHSRHRTALGGHQRTSTWSISYSRGRRGSLSDTGGHGTDTVRDREDEGSNPSPPTIFVFEIGDFRVTLESAAHSWITISYGATKPRRRKRCFQGQCEIAGRRRVATQRPKPADAQGRTVRPYAHIPGSRFRPFQTRDSSQTSFGHDCPHFNQTMGLINASTEVRAASVASPPDRGQVQSRAQRRKAIALRANRRSELLEQRTNW
jgi:hypothetical protein